VSNIPITSFPSAGALTGAEQVPIVQEEVTKRTTVAELVAGMNPFTAGGRTLRFGVGHDGDVVVSSAVTLTRDMFYNNLTIIAGGSIATAAFKVFVAGTLDLTAAPVGAIRRVLSSGASATAAAGASGGSAGGTNTVGGSGGGGTGGQGRSNTNGSQAAATTAFTNANGGPGGSGGAGGNGSSTTGAAARAFTALGAGTLPMGRMFSDLLRGVSFLSGGAGGPGGGGGGGDGVNSGGGGGGGGAGCGVFFLAARIINRGVGTAAAAINAIGGNGGNGRTQALGDVGGGGGAGGGGGGWIYMYFESLVGTPVVGLIDASGGAGGNGGNGFGLGTGAGGGGGGSGGRISIVNLGAGTMSVLNNTTTLGTAGGAPVGITGGTGGAGCPTAVTL